MSLALVAFFAVASSDVLIRTAREEFNAAIVRRDARVIAAILAPTYHLVTGRSDQSHGSEAEGAKWAARFAADPGVGYKRTSREVRVNEAWGLAEETGDWSGGYSTAGHGARASGVYAAKWQRNVAGRWLLQSEVFTTLACDGAPVTCVPPDPIVVPPSVNARPSAHPVTQLKVTILSTMLVGSTEGIGEWGFAALVEADGYKILVDTGARPETVLKNAEELGIDLSTISDLVITHNHSDHTGGLLALRRALRAKNPAALSRAHVGAGVFAPRLLPNGRDANGLTPLRAEYEAMGGVFIVHDRPAELVKGVWLSGPVPRPNAERNWSGSYKVPVGDAFIDDTVSEDSAVVIETAKGLVVLTGCGHAGVVNITQYARKVFGDAPIHALIGGLHTFNATDEQLAWTASKLRETGLAHLLGAHCTGIEAVYRLRDLVGLSRRTAVVGAVGSSYSLDKGLDPQALAR